jgi:hypothetical protein
MKLVRLIKCLNETYSRACVGTYMSDTFPFKTGLKKGDAEDVNILGRSIHTIKKNMKAFVAASQKNGLNINAHKTKYTVKS